MKTFQQIRAWLSGNARRVRRRSRCFELLEPRTLLANDLYQVPGSDGAPTTIRFDSLQRIKGVLKGEFGVFEVDAADGSIDGILPGDATYPEKAIRRAVPVFTAESKAGAAKDLTLAAGGLYGTYLIPYTNSQSWLAARRLDLPVRFSLDAANPAAVDHVLGATSGQGINVISWEKNFGSKRDKLFDDWVVDISIAGGRAVQVPGDATDQVATKFTAEARNTKSKNELRVFSVDDAAGRIGQLLPGTPGYAEAAFSRSQLVFSAGKATGIETTLTFQGGSFFSFYLVQNASQEKQLAKNPTNQSGRKPLAFFDFYAANPDRMGHVKWLGQQRFGIEDATKGGDRDFDDLVARFEFLMLTPQTLPTVTMQLARDTALNNGTNTDGITADPTIQGRIESNSSVSRLRAALDPAIGQVLLDVSAQLANGTFVLDTQTLSTLAQGVLSDGPHRLIVEAENASGKVSPRAELLFTLDRVAPAISVAMAAANDTPPAGDNTTSHERIAINGQTEPGLIVRLIDTNQVVTADSTGRFTFNNVPLAMGTNGFQFRTADVAGNQGQAALTIVRSSPPSVSLQLANDTAADNSTNSDRITSDPTVQGRVTSDTPVTHLRAALDPAESASQTDITSLLLNGEFALDATALNNLAAGGLTDGEHRLVVEAENAGGRTLPRVELVFTLDRIAPTISVGLASADDTLPIGDNTTSLNQVKIEGQTEPGLTVRLAETNQQVVANSLGFFAFPAVSLTVGANSFHVSANDLAGNRGQSSITISRATPPSITLQLSRDTAADNGLNSDQITSDPTVQGTVASDSVVTHLRAAIDVSGGQSLTDITGQLANGSFVLSPTLLDSLTQGGLADGEHRLTVEAENAGGRTLPRAELVFTLDRTAPAISAALATADDTLPIGDNTTSLSQVTIEGQTEPGLTVRLTETSQQVTSDSSGRFAFANVPLALGANQFHFRAADTAGNQGQTELTISRSSAPAVTVGLERDTARQGTTNNDGITSDPTMVGRVTSDSSVASLLASFEEFTGDNGIVVTDRVNADGIFRLDTATLSQIFGSALPDGDHVLFLRARSSLGRDSEVVQLSFRLDTVAPPLAFDLAPESDSGIPRDQMTEQAIVTIAGSTEVGATVAFQPGGSVLVSSNGAFRLENLALEHDGNTVVGRAEDLAGNVQQVSRIFMRCPFDDDLTGWTIVEDGGSDQSRGGVSAIDCAATLREGDSFVVGLERSFVVPAAPSTITLTFADLQFDRSATGAIKDAFEVALVDREGRPLVPTYAVGRDAVLNVSDGLAPILSNGTTLDGNRLSIDLSDAIPGVVARLIVRLVNNDGDQNTSVRLTDFSLPAGAVAAALSSSDIVSAPASLAAYVAAPRGISSADIYENSWGPAVSASSSAAIATSSLQAPAGIGTPSLVLDDFPTQTNAPGVVALSGFATADVLPGTPTSGDNVFVAFQDFSDSSALTLNSDARVVATSDGSVLRLTPAETWKSGSAFSDTRVSANQFSSAFQFRITGRGGISDASGEIGADGLVFVIQPVSASLGGAGFGIGYEGIRPSVGVEFDTFQNGYDLLSGIGVNDPSSNHVAIDIGTVAHYDLANVANVSPSFDNGEIWNAWVDYDGTTLDVRVSLDTTRPVLPTLSRPIDIPGIIGEQLAYVGFTSGTGSAFGNHDILKWQYNDRFDPITSSIPNRIEYVTVNGVPVEVLDDQGRFYTTQPIEQGDNVFEIKAFDMYGQSVSSTVTIVGAPPPAANSLQQYADVTGSFSGVYGRTSFRDGSNLLFVDLATRNDGVFEADAPLLVGIRNISNPSVQVANPDGFFPDGTPYFDFTDVVAGGRLGPGAQSGSPTISFVNRERKQFDYELVFFSKLNETPRFTSLPSIEAAASSVWQYDAAALDPDGDSLRFRLLTGPAGMTIDESSGFVRWAPGLGDRGIVNVGLEVSDGRGGVAQQTFVLNVVDAAPNRPPIIRSMPVIDAWVSGIPNNYRYTLDAFDPDQDTVTFVLIDTVIDGTASAPPVGMQVAPSTGVISWSPNASQIGRHWVTVQASDGRGGIATQRFQIKVHAALPTAAQPASAVPPTQPGNSAPVIASTPPLTAVAGTEYRYQPSVSDAEGDVLAFALPQAPLGMLINVTTGELTWTPLREQIGDELVVIRASDARGGVDIQSFMINVSAANTAPLITSVPPLVTALVGSAWVYEVRAQDAENDQIAFRLATPVPGVSINSQSGQLIYTAAAPSPVQIEVIAEDGRGGTAHQMFTVDAAIAIGNQPPRIDSTPPLNATVGLPYAYRMLAFDSNADPLSFSLLTGPAGMTLSSDGVLRWLPVATDIGTRLVRVHVGDGRGGDAMQEFELQVAATSTNQSPRIVSIPSTRGTVGDLFRYDARANDLDHDPLGWQLISAPPGMSIDSQTGAVRWLPADDQIGRFEVTLAATDPAGAEARQSFELTIGSTILPPQIVSIPPTVASVKTPYTYAIRAVAPNRDAISFSILAGQLSNMSLDASGILRWTPTADQVGSHTILLSAEGSTGGRSTQEFAIIVGTEAINRAPVITSKPSLRATAEVPYVYTIVAQDPNGESPVHSIVNPSPGMTIDPTSGVLTWTPSLPAGTDEALQQITVMAADARGAKSTQTFGVVVRRNHAPQIESAAPASATVGARYRYDVRAKDLDSDALNYSLEQAPAGMTLDNLGRILWTPTTADLGTVLVTVKVDDGRGGSASQAFVITVAADAEAPRVSLQLAVSNQVFLNSASVDANQEVTYRLVATDNVAVVSYVLTVDGQNVVLDQQQQARLKFSQVRDVLAIAMVRDAAGNERSSQFLLHVGNPAINNRPQPTDIDPADLQPPLVEIISPTANAATNGTVAVMGTVDDPENRLWYWKLYYARTDLIDSQNVNLSDSDYHLLNEGSQEIVNGKLGDLDTTLLSHDSYTLVLAGYDLNGQGFVRLTPFSVVGNAQLGNFALEFTDLEIPLAGIPIKITRRYDTLQAGDNSDFGFGWSLGIADARIRETVPQGGDGFFTTGDAFVVGTRVFLTNPEGKRVSFTFQPEARGSFVFGTLWYPKFVPDPGVYDKLLVEEMPLQQRPDGTFAVFPFGYAYNPDSYRLVPDVDAQLVYEYDQFRGLQRIVDPNGNTLEYRDDGIFHSSGAAIRFVRDGQGRISQILDPAGNPIRYSFDADGNLQSITNQENLITGLTYRPERPHYLDEIRDPLGKLISKTIYDADGRIDTVVDGMGNIRRVDVELANNRETVFDGRGNATVLTYNSRGNVTRKEDAEGGVTRFEYTDPLNPDKETRIIDSRGFATSYTYDERGNLLSIETVLGTTLYRYTDANKLALMTDANGHTTTYHYDIAGNLLSVIDALGNAESYSYDALGRRITRTDARGFTFTNAYPADSSTNLPEKIINPDGSLITYAYNQYGQPTIVVDEEGKRTEARYDRLGRITEVIDGAGKSTQFVYLGNQLERQIDPDGNTTRYEYYADARIKAMIDPEGGRVEYTYNRNGEIETVKDAVGNVTTYVYDRNNFNQETIDPLGKSTFYDADSEGNMLEMIDRDGRRRTFEYDAANRLTKELWWDGVAIVGVLNYEFDSVGNLLSANDLGSRLSFRYDALNRQIEQDNVGTPGATRVILTSRYDANGNAVQVTDNIGNTVASTFNFRSNLDVRSWSVSTNSNIVADYSYLLNGKPSELRRQVTSSPASHDIVTNYTYDERNLLSSILHRSAEDLPLVDFAVSRYGNGLVKSITQNDVTNELRYNKRGELVAVSRPGLSVESFVYDANGNRQSWQYDTSSTTYSIAPGNRYYQYVEDGEVHFVAYYGIGAVKEVTTPSSNKTTKYEFDSRGRLTTLIDTDALTTTVTHIRYDALDRPILRERNLIVEEQINILSERWALLTSGSQRVVLNGANRDEVLGVANNDRTVTWQLFNHQGSTVATMTSGVLDRIRPVSAFGVGASDNALFQGHPAISEDLFDFRARVYNARIGRFVSEDPFKFAAGDLNLSRSLGNSPYNSTDSFGTIESGEYASIYLTTARFGFAFGMYVESIGLYFEYQKLLIEGVGERKAVVSALGSAITNEVSGTIEDYVVDRIAKYVVIRVAFLKALSAGPAGAAVGGFIAGYGAGGIVGLELGYEAIRADLNHWLP